MKTMKNILVTSGGTKVPVDRVRHLGNMSNGTFGAKIARALLYEFAGELDNLTYFHTKRSETPFGMKIDFAEPNFSMQKALAEMGRLHDMHEQFRDRYFQSSFKTFEEYDKGMTRMLESCRWDVILLACAASDYLVANYVDGKIRSKDALKIELTPAPKIISRVRAAQPNAVIVGFKLLVDSEDAALVKAAQESAQKNGCDFVVSNDLRDIEADEHRLLIVDKDGLFEEFKTDHGNPEHLAQMVAALAGVCTLSGDRSLRDPEDKE
jgi:phosphopantothenoylcysteine synthetase/decarboxylase